MINLDSIKDAFYDWVNVNTTALITSRIQWQFQNIPIPEGKDPFFTLRIFNLRQIGDADFKEPEAPVTEGDKDMIITLDGLLEIQAFQQGCYAEHVNLMSSLNKPDVHQTFKDAGVITWNSPNPVQDISGLDDSENEERSFSEMPFRICSTESNIDLGSIVIVNAEGTYKQPGKTDIIQTLNIDAS